MIDNSHNQEHMDEQSGTFLAHSAAEMAYKFYYNRDKKGLEMLIKDFEAVMAHTKNCIDCLDFLNSQGESFAKIYLLLEYMGRDGVDEQFVSNLEALVERARECLDKDEGFSMTQEEEFDMICRLNQTIDQHEKEHRSEEFRKYCVRVVNE